MWIKYRHTFSSGPEKEWSYEEVTPSGIESALRELKEEYNWSEHYRGIEYDTLSKIPLHEIRRRMKIHENSINYHSDQFARFRIMEENRKRNNEKRKKN